MMPSNLVLWGKDLWKTLSYFSVRDFWNGLWQENKFFLGCSLVAIVAMIIRAVLATWTFVNTFSLFFFPLLWWLMILDYCRCIRGLAERAALETAKEETERQ